MSAWRTSTLGAGGELGGERGGERGSNSISVRCPAARASRRVMAPLPGTDLEDRVLRNVAERGDDATAGICIY